ncbi:E3 ubiquitin-protein ligase HECTD3 isoform X2 [Hydra vulgaris]|uniref:E3 ubiquitin-protein ligase HECTD3 isoform X2 n=1 Tax=Hydra vulgaris TaxID=6087 RepID=A0ABM4DH86_HYDVU
MGANKARKRLASIRCVLKTVESIKNNNSLPKELCFVPQFIEYVIHPDLYNSGNKAQASVHFNIWSSPLKSNRIIGRLTVHEEAFKNFSITVHGEDYSNDAGDWIQLTKESIATLKDVISDCSVSEAWIIIHPRDSKTDNVPKLIPKFEISESKKKVPKSFMLKANKNDKKENKVLYRWQSVVEMNYMLQLIPRSLPQNVDMDAVNHLSNPPSNWSLEADEELVKFLVDHSSSHDLYIGGASRYVESITVSSEQDSANNLLDNDPDTYWESDGSSGRHHIRLQIKAGVIIQKLIIGVDDSDDNYMPSRVLVYCLTDSVQSKLLNEVRIDGCQNGDVVILENAAEYYPQIEIRIKECKDDGIDCRIHYIKIVSSKQRQCRLNKDLFEKDLVRYPKLQSIEVGNRSCLYYRAQVLNRFISLFDSVIQYLLPLWEYTVGTYKCLEEIRQLLPLSKKRQGLIENCLRETEGAAPSTIPKIYINRHLAAQQLVDPTFDPDGKSSIFNQLYEALRVDRCETKMDYRWPPKYEQWWECKFIGEGIIDQGGGFRDSLSDLAEELCPSSPDALLPLPYFVRSPNQFATSNIYRDCYIPNSNCRIFAHYEWIGQIMGACLRGNENLVLSLPLFIWKMLNCEKISWERDYFSIDATEVRFHESVAKMTEEEFIKTFENTLTYSMVLANGDVVPVIEGGENIHVSYENRIEFLDLVKKKRLSEFNEQVIAMRNGLEKVVPKAVLALMTWQELEKRICGDPIITVEALKKSVHYQDFEDESNDPSIKIFWQAIENFTNEDRSRFLRFVTGRRRLPTPLIISGSKMNAALNSLPESATCSHTLFLPNYSSVAHAEERIRYASYNCIAIDADMSPWED